MSIYFLDYSTSIPPISMLKSNNITGVSRYLSWLPNPKVISKGEYLNYLANGIDVILNWEYDAQDELGGASAGAIQATEAVRQAILLGYPKGATIYFSGDFDETPAQGAVGGPVWAYFNAARPILHAAGYRIGVYGGYYLVTRLEAQGLVDDLWQAYAWSGGQWSDAAARQTYNGYPFGGYSVDLDQILGIIHSALHPNNPLVVNPVTSPAFNFVKSADVTAAYWKLTPFVLAQDGPGGPIYFGANFISKRWVQNVTDLTNLVWWLKNKGYDYNVYEFPEGTIHGILGDTVGATPPAAPAS